ncbi:uncharacterized protein LOC134271024, partial [Saccostrea cucullata]|uniref:uncharacterized protein LOC134271024 n=1 Tax=Saccostrea cuccullata TaxID=36930 RepID=UPI002ED4A6B6
MLHSRFFLNAIFFSLVLTDGSLKTGYDNLQWGKRLLGRLLTIIAQVSPLDCAEECLIRSECLSFNYRRAEKFCELNYESGEGSNAKLSDEEGWIFSRRESWPMEISEACKNIRCAFNQKCIKNSYVSTECKLAHCHPVDLQLPQNVQNFSSEKALNLGSKHSLTCVDGYNPSGDETVECLRNGTWSDVNITCHECVTGWICNNDKGTCYRRIGSPLTQEAAMRSCRICDSYLVEVNDDEENRWITENVLKGL